MTNGIVQQHFDSWTSTFGETILALEFAPEGTGYRAKISVILIAKLV